MIQLSTLFESDNFKTDFGNSPQSTGPVTIKFTRPFPGDREITIECQYTFDPASRWLPVEWVESGHDPPPKRFFPPNRFSPAGPKKKPGVGDREKRENPTRARVNNRVN